MSFLSSATSPCTDDVNDGCLLSAPTGTFHFCNPVSRNHSILGAEVLAAQAWDVPHAQHATKEAPPFHAIHHAAQQRDLRWHSRGSAPRCRLELLSWPPSSANQIYSQHSRSDRRGNKRAHINRMLLARGQLLHVKSCTRGWRAEAGLRRPAFHPQRSAAAGVVLARSFQAQ